MSAECGDRDLAFTAGTEAIMTLYSERRYEDCVEAFRARRETFDSQADSLRNEKTLILAELALDDEQQVCSVGRRRSLDLAFEESLKSRRLDVDALTLECERRAFHLRHQSFYPNPFNSQSVIAFNMDQKGLIDAAVFDLDRGGGWQSGERSSKPVGLADLERRTRSRRSLFRPHCRTSG
jgi:hypothetical protein